MTRQIYISGCGSKSKITWVILQDIFFPCLYAMALAKDTFITVLFDSFRKTYN